MSAAQYLPLKTLILAALLSACGAVGNQDDTNPPEETASATVTATAEATATASPTAEGPTPTAPTQTAAETATVESDTPTEVPSTPTSIPATPTAEPTPPLNGLQCAIGKVELDGYCVPDLPGGWTQIFPEGDTICSRGTPFSYFVRPGTVNKLGIGFDGGGACWDAVTCSEENPTYSEEVNNGDNPDNLANGALDFNDPENPVKDWFMVFVPYCTGDIHWGDAVTTYERKATYPEVTIHHKGFINGQAVMSWIYKNFEKPESIFVTGISAGAYGSLMFAPYLMDHYPDSRIVQNGDSGVGAITDNFLTDEEGIQAWDAQKNIPEFFGDIRNAPIEDLSFADVYIAAAEYFPNQMFSQFNTYEDDVQKVFYATMGGLPNDWNPEMERLIGEISDAVPNFRYYTSWGTRHGVLAYDEFYSYQTDGSRLRDWYTTLVDGDVTDNVHCVDCVSEEFYTVTE